MNFKNFIIGALVGAVVLFLLGFVIYTILLADYMAANSNASVMKADEDMSLPLIFVGNLCMAALLSYIYVRWAGISTFGTGLQAGLVIGILVALSYSLINFATTNVISTLSYAIVDSVVYSVMVGLTGGVIGLVLGRLK